MAVYAPTAPELAPMVDDEVILLLRKIAAILYAVTYGTQTLTIDPV